jgi:proline dehydrogenase
MRTSPRGVSLRTCPFRTWGSVARVSVARKAILAAAASPRVNRFVRRYGMRLGASRFVAGETLEQALDVVEGLNAAGLHANTSILGEDVADEAEVRAVAAEYERVLDAIAKRRLRCNVALKLTQLGLLVDAELAYENASRVLDRASAHGNFVRLDMEHSRIVDATLDVYRRLRGDGRENVGCVLQSYLYRTPADLESLLPLGPNVRLVKGAYLEPPDVAYPRKDDVDAAYVRLLERALEGGAYVAVATHDEKLVEHAVRVAPSDRFEIQMLYGVRPQLQLDLVARGYKVLVATPYGPEWYPYLMRRLAERPANVGFFLRSLVRR